MENRRPRGLFVVPGRNHLPSPAAEAIAALPAHRVLLSRVERTYGERYQQRYVRCNDCDHDRMFVPFSCRQRCLCPSCHQKRTLLVADSIAHGICAAVPHRQLVFTIPKRLRIHFRYDCLLLGDMACAAWETVAKSTAANWSEIISFPAWCRYSNVWPTRALALPYPFNCY